MSRKKGKATESDKVIGKNLRALRKEKKLSQQALSERVQLTFQQIQKYESGTDRISASMLAKLSKVLEVPISWFFKNIDHFEDDDARPEDRLEYLLKDIDDKRLISLLRVMLNNLSEE